MPPYFQTAVRRIPRHGLTTETGSVEVSVTLVAAHARAMGGASDETLAGLLESAARILRSSANRDGAETAALELSADVFASLSIRRSVRSGGILA